MGQQVHIKNLEDTSKISEQFLENILNDKIYLKETEELYTKAKAKQNLATSLFTDISEAIEKIEETGEELSESEKIRVEDLLVKYNLMVLAYCLTHRKSLELCCNNFFRCVIGNRADYTEADTSFYLKLRGHALASAIKESIFDENYNKEADIRNYLPCESSKHYFYGGEVRSPLDLELLVEAKNLCDNYLEYGTEDLENEFYQEALNDDLIRFVKSILDVIAKRSASYSGKGKRSEIHDQDESRSAKKAKTSIFDPTEDARKIEESEIFSLPSSPLPNISGGSSPNNSDIIKEFEANLYEIEDSDDGGDFYDAPANLSEPDVSTNLNSVVERSYNDLSSENNHIEIKEDTDEYNEPIESNATRYITENKEETRSKIEPREQSREQSREPLREQSREQSREPSREQSRGQSREQSTVSEVSENRARDNDSDYSPGERESSYNATVDPTTDNGRSAYRYPNPNQKREPVRDRISGSKQKLRAKAVPWTAEEVRALEDGLRSCKAPLWVKIIADASPKLQNRTNVQCKDKAKTELKKLERLGYTEKKDLGPYGYVKFPELDD